MLFLGSFFIIFGTVILIYPQFLAYIIAFFFLFFGVSILSTRFLFRNNLQKGWKFGAYEIIRGKR